MTDFYSKPNAVLFASTDCSEAIYDAKKYIADNKIAGEVKLLRHDGLIIVVRV